MRRRLAAALVVFVLAAPLAGARAAQAPTVHAGDDYFDPGVIRVDPGTTITWDNAGRSPHTVTADNGSFDSGNLDPDASYSKTFSAPGVYRFFCRYHGARGGIGMSGVVLVGNVALPGASKGVGPGREKPPTTPGHTIRVPKDQSSIQRAVDRARPGDMILISPGVYRESVTVVTPFLTIRGTDRNAVILDGGFKKPNGVHVVEADGVAIENMTARHYLLNGFEWTDVNGYRGSYLTAYDDGDYGIFAIGSVWGQFDHSYASGHPDSGFYIGQCNPCHAVITDVLSENNALGYSGTNAGGDLLVANSEWRHNMAGIVPNTLDSELMPPQREVEIAGNYVHDNNNTGAPAKPLEYPALGIGIMLAGGRGDLVRDNVVEDSQAFGIAIVPSLDKHLWLTSRNLVIGNVVRRSGRGDLALAAPAAGRDCFQDNDARTSIPPAIEIMYGCDAPAARAGGGDLSATIATLVLFIQSNSGKYPHGDWKSQPVPPAQPQMPSAATAPAAPAIPETAVPSRITARTVAQIKTTQDAEKTRQEVTVLGFPLSTTWWGLLVGVYAYLLPLMLYTAWVVIALWDLTRRDDEGGGARVGWMALVLIVPVLGPIAYYVFGRSPIPRSTRAMLIVGALVVYAAFAVLAVVVGG